MEFFKYDTNDPRAEQYELLQSHMENWEDEIVEFKTASGQYSIDKIGQYFSAISNEANLMNQQYGWLVLGVSEIDKKELRSKRDPHSFLENSNTTSQKILLMYGKEASNRKQ